MRLAACEPGGAAGARRSLVSAVHRCPACAPRDGAPTDGPWRRRSLTCLPPPHLIRRSSTYHALATRLRGLAQELCCGRLAFLLEGGYETEAVGESVAEVFLALLGRPSVEGAAPLALPHPEPTAEVAALVAQLCDIHGL